jgi:hypothetical protein
MHIMYEISFVRQQLHIWRQCETLKLYSRNVIIQNLYLSNKLFTKTKQSYNYNIKIDL